ncbi:YjbF family lipoprotein [Shewanella sp. SG41-4]|uniref:YjbF family lipoprotein n=1 Tax=Shewanella sp. SG41-4 TaxID=2760976 RepID=UPI0015FF88FE|nr:YjbF family lipoprotein [Shewanella sp. SG41-4]MBB1440494.1 YjbF family lipoprotein [Shewanella sp. SG41-4]
MSSIFNNKNLLTLFFFLALTGCSNTFVQIGGMLKESIVGLPDDNISANEIENSPYSSVYVKINDSHQAYVLLALAEAPQTMPATIITTQNVELKWISSDAGMLVTRNGRLLKTVNLFEGNRINIDSNQTDPVALGLHLASTPIKWQSTIDWQPGYHVSYQQLSTFSFVTDETLTINDKPITLKKFNEHVIVPDIDIEYDNQFWIDPSNGQVIKSHQKIAPNLAYIDITVLKPYEFKDVK